MRAHENSRTLLKLFVTTVHTNKYFIDRHLVRFARFGFFSKLHKSFLDFRFKVEIISYAKFLKRCAEESLVVNKRHDKVF